MMCLYLVVSGFSECCGRSITIKSSIGMMRQASCAPHSRKSLIKPRSSHGTSHAVGPMPKTSESRRCSEIHCSILGMCER